jgi:PAS domain S-box-containing protein
MKFSSSGQREPSRAGNNDRANPHFVHLYERDESLVELAARFVGAGIAAGEPVVLIATPDHIGAIESRLESRGLALSRARGSGLYQTFDAAETLARFMLDGRPTEEQFRQVIGALVERAAQGAQRVHAFGEMVAVLWARGECEAAIRLEQLWSKLLRELPVSLLCAYPAAAFEGDDDMDRFFRICAEHTDVLAAESDESAARAAALLSRYPHTLEPMTAERSLIQRALAAADETRARLAAIVESSDDAIVGKDLKGVITSWNQGAEKIFGYTADEMVGQSILRIVPADRSGEVTKILSTIARGERVEHFESERVRKDGQRIFVSLTVSPIRDSAGRIIGASKIARDVTDRKREEHAKDQFLAMLGHELRNPLAAVRNAVTLATLDSGASGRALEIARHATDQLARLVDDLLDVTRITRGLLTLRREVVVFGDIVQRAIDTVRAFLEQREIALTVTLPPREVKIHADAARIEQVVANLLTNAAKYTDAGGRVTVALGYDNGEAVLSVRDTGIGIPADLLPRVFDLFVQAEQSLDRRPGGLGIGLTLVKQLVEMHGGRVAAHSEGVGRGAEFIVRLPAAVGQRPTLAADAAPLRRAAVERRVLIVEDNADAAESLKMLLELLGMHVRTVGDGVTALEAARANPPDVMLIDIGLPGMNGYELAEHIRRDERLRYTTLVALTGYGQEEDRQRALAAGFDYHLVKPVDFDTVERLVAGIPTTPSIH